MNKAERNLFIMVKAAKELFRIGSIAILIFMWLVQGRIGEALAWFLCWIILDEFDRQNILPSLHTRRRPQLRGISKAHTENQVEKGFPLLHL